MRKIVSVILLIVFVLCLSGCAEEGRVIYVYNWGEYMDESLREAFTKETGVKVIYEEFATNEDMYVKLKNGGTQYDIAIPSDYMIEKMIKEDMLETIDYSKLSNFKNIGNQYKSQPFDPENKFSVPYFWGTVGILYNTTKVDEPIDSWSVLFDEKYKGQVLMLDSQRDTLMVALKLLGFSMNTRNEAELEAAKELLIDQKKRDMVMAYVVDNGKDIMVSGGATFMQTWNGEALALRDENPDLAFALPKEGTNVWYDAMVVPKGAEHYDDAMLFMDFMMRADIAAKNTEYVGYSTPNIEGYKLLDPDLQMDKVAYPDMADLKQAEVFADPGDFLEVFNRVWTEIKAQ